MLISTTIGATAMESSTLWEAESAMVLLPSPSATFPRLPELQIMPPLSSISVDSTGTQRVLGETLSSYSRT